MYGDNPGGLEMKATDDARRYAAVQDRRSEMALDLLVISPQTSLVPPT
jgi:hypothetical protein